MVPLAVVDRPRAGHIRLAWALVVLKVTDLALPVPIIRQEVFPLVTSHIQFGLLLVIADFIQNSMVMLVVRESNAGASGIET